MFSNPGWFSSRTSQKTRKKEFCKTSSAMEFGTSNSGKLCGWSFQLQRKKNSAASQWWWPTDRSSWQSWISKFGPETNENTERRYVQPTVSPLWWVKKGVWTTKLRKFAIQKGDDLGLGKLGNFLDVHFHLDPRSLTAWKPLKNGGTGRRSPFLLGFGNFSGVNSLFNFGRVKKVCT